MPNISAVVMLLSSMLPYVSQQRIDDVMKDVVSVVKSQHETGSLKSSMTPDDSLTMLTAAIVIESGLKEDVEKCKLVGDQGRSLGLGQVMRGQNWEGHTREEICNDRKLQLELALHVIDRCWVRTPRPDAAFRCYAAGDAAKKSKTAWREYSVHLRLKESLKRPQATTEDKNKKEK